MKKYTSKFKEVSVLEEFIDDYAIFLEDAVSIGNIDVIKKDLIDASKKYSRNKKAKLDQEKITFKQLNDEYIKSLRKSKIDDLTIVDFIVLKMTMDR